MADANADTVHAGDFKVIIIGGSLSGLTLALALERCGIDYLLLEKREIAPSVGQSIFLVPCATLVLDQLGVGECIRENAFPMDIRRHRFEDMKIFSQSDDLLRLGKKTGIPAFWIDRQPLLGGIYEGIQDKSASKIREGEGIVSYRETAHGISVTTDKGNTFEGSILVGADGVHSTVRALVSEQIRAQNPALNAKLADQMACPFQISYRCLFATTHNRWSHNPTKKIIDHDGFANSTYYREARIGVVLTHGAPDKIFWGIYLPQKTTTDYHPSVRDDYETRERDMEAIIEKYGHLSVTPWFTIQDLWNSRERGSLVGQEEGLAPRWNNGGRVIMIGDSVHKVTVSVGLGGNLCVDDVCVLVNGLVPLLEQTNSSPSTKQLADLFAQCAKAQWFRSKFAQVSSRFFNDFESQSTWWAGAFRYLFAAIPAAVKMQLYYMYTKSAPTLTVLPPLKGDVK